MAANLPPSIKFQPLVAGQPIPGGTVKFYAAGTTTPQAVYAADGTTTIGTELTLDANGSTSFRLGSGLTYKIDLYDALGAQVLNWPEDHVSVLDLPAFADNTVASLGAGLVGFGASVVYAAGTIGAYLRSIAAAAGSALVGFIQAGTGAVGRTAQAKMRETVSITDFGSVEGGVTDCTTAFTNTPDGSYIPAGTYKVTSAIAKHFYSLGDVTIVGGGSIAKVVNLNRHDALPQAQAFWSKIRSGQRDAYLLLIGDSTGNETTEWFYQWVLSLAAKCPAHTIKYRLWDGSAWGAESTVQTGTGARTIYIDNASVAGYKYRDFFGTAMTSVKSLNRTYDLLLINLGHNFGSLAQEDGMRAGLVEGYMEFRGSFPGTPMIQVLQNPRIDYPDYSDRVVNCMRAIAPAYDIGLMNVYDYFINAGVPAGWYVDQVHPNPTGYLVWRDIALGALAQSVGGYAIHSTGLSITKDNLAPNPCFNLWGPSGPVGWSLNNATVAQDASLYETFGYSLKLTAGAGANPWMYVDLSRYLGVLRGKTVTIAARIYRTTAAGGENAGRINVGGTTTTSASNSAYLAAEPDGWRWAAHTAVVAANESSLTCRIFAGKLDGTETGKYVNIDRIIIVVGGATYEVNLSSQPEPQISQFYSSANVGKYAGDGVLTVATNDVSFASSTGVSNYYINLSNLVVGRQYTMTWVNSAGAGSVYARNEPNGGSTTITSATMGTQTLTWTATATNNSIMAGSAGAAWANNDISITENTFISVASVAGAQTLSPVLPKPEVAFEITGTNTITSIDPTGWAGKSVVLKFASTAALTDGGNLKLSANFTGSADDILVLFCDGTNWFERSRSVN